MSVDLTQAGPAAARWNAPGLTVLESLVLDLSGITTSATITAITVPAGFLVFGCAFIQSELVDGTSPTASVGVTATAAAVYPATNVDGFIDNIALDSLTWVATKKTSGHADEDFGIEGGVGGVLFPVENTIDLYVSVTGTTTTGAGKLYAWGIQLY